MPEIHDEIIHLTGVPHDDIIISGGDEMPTRGRPHLTIRFARAEIDALKQHAENTGTTYGEIIRNLVYDYMAANGIKPIEKQIAGQISTDELDV